MNRSIPVNALIGWMALASQAAAGQQTASGDFNGDGRDDLAIGVPSENLGLVADAGVVHVIFGSANKLTAAADQFWHQDRTGVLDVAEPNDHFGQAVASGDFDNDGFADLAIAVGEDDSVIGFRGGVHVLYGSAVGLVATGNQFWNQINTGGADTLWDSFGATLAVGDFDGDDFEDLAIGEPGDYVGGIDAGSVTILYGGGSGLASAGSQHWNQNSGSVADACENQDNFGSSLAAGDFDGNGFDDLAIGSPSEDLGLAIDTGAVNVLYGSASGISDTGNQLWHQNSTSVLDSCESNDSFGCSLAAGDFDGNGRDDLAVGVRWERLGSANRTGAVHVIYGSVTALTANNDQFWHQNMPGILETCESNDEFGNTLVAGDFDGNGRDDLAIGIRLEGLEANGFSYSFSCGAVCAIYGTATGLKWSGNQFWHSDSAGIEGEPNGALFSASLTTGDFDGNGSDDLVASAPGENPFNIGNAGVVHVIYGSSLKLRSTGSQFWHQDKLGIADECESDDGFGGWPP